MSNAKQEPHRADHIMVSLTWEYLLSNLFGKRNYHGRCGSTRVSTWKKDVLKVFRFLRRAIHQSVQGDAAHRRHLEERCDAAIEEIGKLRTGDMAAAEAVAWLAEICFALVGGIPKHWDSTAPYNPRQWTLDHHRTLVYVRSGAQLAWTILDQARRERWESRDELWEAYRQSKDPVAFLEWFRWKFPQRYAELL